MDEMCYEADVDLLSVNNLTTACPGPCTLKKHRSNHRLALEKCRYPSQHQARWVMVLRFVTRGVGPQDFSRLSSGHGKLKSSE